MLSPQFVEEEEFGSVALCATCPRFREAFAPMTDWVPGPRQDPRLYQFKCDLGHETYRFGPLRHPEEAEAPTLMPEDQLPPLKEKPKEWKARIEGA